MLFWVVAAKRLVTNLRYRGDFFLGQSAPECDGAAAPDFNPPTPRNAALIHHALAPHLTLMQVRPRRNAQKTLWMDAAVCDL
jgi:hypothetical protein